MKIAFLGSPEFSQIILKKLHSSKHQVVCIVTNLDKESGRGKKVIFSPVKQFGLDNNIPVLQYKSVSKEGEAEIKSFNPDVLITASFGQILRQNILNLAPLGVINVHTSLLPKYRGSAPINWAIIKGEKTTGVTIMKTNLGLDTGDIILSKKLDILPDETAGELTLRLASLGAEVLLEALDKLSDGSATFTPQKEEESSYYPMLSKEMGKLDFNLPASELQNLCNGLNPWPICYCMLNSLTGEKLKVYKLKPVLQLPANIDLKDYENGQVVVSNSKLGLMVKCASGLALLDVIQAPNSKAMSSKSYLNGKTIPVGTKFQNKKLLQ